VSQIRLYIDEDSMDQAFLQALRARGVDIRTAYEEGMVGRSDIDQLRWAATQGRVLYSFNVGDFYHLHTTFLGQQEDHAGIILVQQQRYAVGEQLRGVLRLMAATSAEEMVNQVVFLSAWI
jgi:Domain of unknown function (DUF5615)